MSLQRYNKTIFLFRKYQVHRISLACNTTIFDEIFQKEVVYFSYACRHHNFNILAFYFFEGETKHLFNIFCGLDNASKLFSQRYENNTASVVEKVQFILNHMIFNVLLTVCYLNNLSIEIICVDRNCSQICVVIFYQLLTLL